MQNFSTKNRIQQELLQGLGQIFPRDRSVGSLRYVAQRVLLYLKGMQSHVTLPSRFSRDSADFNMRGEL